MIMIRSSPEWLPGSRSLLERRFWLQLTDQRFDFSPQPQFVDKAVEVGRFDAEQAGGLAQVAHGSVDSLLDHPFFSRFGRLSGDPIDVKVGSAREWGQGANLFWQVRRRDEFRRLCRSCVVAQRRIIDGALQFAYIARPMVAFQTGEGFGGNQRDWRLAFRAIFPSEVPGEQFDILTTLPQRRQGYGEDFEPVIKVFAERSSFDGGLQIAIGRGEHSDVHLD